MAHHLLAWCVLARPGIALHVSSRHGMAETCCTLLPPPQSPRQSTSTARVSLRKYFIPGCVGRGLDLDLRIRPAAPLGVWKSKWVGPSWAQVGGPKPGPSGWAQAGPKLGPSQKFVTQTNPKIKILKIKIRVAQNFGKVWISRKKNLPAPFGAIPGNFLRGPGKSKNC